MNTPNPPVMDEAPAIEDLSREAEELTAEQADEVTGGAGAGKVIMQDFHFTQQGSGLGAGKVSLQDFHF